MMFGANTKLGLSSKQGSGGMDLRDKKEKESEGMNPLLEVADAAGGE